MPSSSSRIFPGPTNLSSPAKTNSSNVISQKIFNPENDSGNNSGDAKQNKLELRPTKNIPYANKTQAFSPSTTVLNPIIISLFEHS